MNSILQEAKAIIKLALPIAIINIFIRAIDLTDAVMAGRTSTADLAMVSLSLSIWEPLFLFCLGCLYAITPVITQYIGKGKKSRTAMTIQHGMLVSLLLSVWIILVLQQVDYLASFLQITPDLLANTGRYLFFLSFGVPALLGYLVLRNLCESWSYLKPVLYINIAGFIINIPLNYIFIKGIIVPEFGGMGCALATAMTRWFMLFSLMMYVRKNAGFQSVLVLQRWFRWRLTVFRDLLVTGLPVGLTLFAEVSMFAVAGIFIAGFGVIHAASHQIAFDTASILFMLPLALASATTIRVGFYRGAAKSACAHLVARISLMMALLFVAVNITVLWLLQQLIPAWYTDDPAVLVLAGSLLWLVMALQPGDVFQINAMGILRGYKDTLVPFYVVILAYWLTGFPVGLILAKTNWVTSPLGAYGFWLGFVISLSLSSILLIIRIIRQNRVHIFGA